MLYHTWGSPPFSATAAVDFQGQPGDFILWEHNFIPAGGGGAGGLADPQDMIFANWDYTSTPPSLTLTPGLWRATALSGNFNDSGANVSLQVSGQYLNPLIAQGQSHEIAVAVGTTEELTALQHQSNFDAVIRVEQLSGIDDAAAGLVPDVTTFGTQLIIRLTDTPQLGVLTARARAYNASNVQQAVSNDLVLSIVASSGGGC